MAKILLAAEAYGYGPVAKATAIARSLRARGHVARFAGTGTALRFSEETTGLYDEVHPGTGAANERGDLDAVVSVMDPWTVLWARHQGLPVVYVDSLYWMWHWSDDARGDLDDLVDRFAALPDEPAASEAFGSVPMHDSQYLAHRLATVACVQRYTDVDSSLLRRDLRPVKVGAVVDRRFTTETRKDLVLASVSGSVNPFTSAERAREWTETVVQVLVEAGEKSGSTIDVWVCGNPDVLGAVAEPPRTSRVLLRPQRDHSDYLQLLSRATCLLAPPGITSMAEAWAYGVPFVSLPQQHYAHSTIWDRVASTSPRAFPNLLVPPPVDDDRGIEALTAAMIDDVVDRLAPERRSEAVAQLVEIFEEVRSDSGTGLRDAQAESFAAVFGTSEGAEEVADVVERHVQAG